LEKVSDKLKTVFINNKNDNIRGLFYDLMIYIHENSSELNFKSVAKSSIIHGLSDKFEEI